MPVTLTIKKVPDRLAEKLRARAAGSHRSLQGELMAILNEAISASSTANEPAPAYQVKKAATEPAAHGRRLTLRELWERARRLGATSPGESAAIIRALRDERHRR